MSSFAGRQGWFTEHKEHEGAGPLAISYYTFECPLFLFLSSLFRLKINASLTRWRIISNQNQVAVRKFRPEIHHQMAVEIIPRTFTRCRILLPMRRLSHNRRSYKADLCTIFAATENTANTNDDGAYFVHCLEDFTQFTDGEFEEVALTTSRIFNERYRPGGLWESRENGSSLSQYKSA